MARAIYYCLSFLLLAAAAPTAAQQHDRYWMGLTTLDNKAVEVSFEEDSIAYDASNTSEILIDMGSLAICNAEGVFQFYTNGNVIVSWDHHIMEGGKGFNEGATYDDFGTFMGDTVMNLNYNPFTYQVIPDAYDENIYYMVHAFIIQLGDCEHIYSPKMQLSKIDMSANGGKGKVVYKNHYFDETRMGLSFALVRHGNGRDWWVVRPSQDGLTYRSTLLHRDTVVHTVESVMPGLSSAWFTCEDTLISGGNLLHASRDGNILLDNYGVGHAKLMAFDRCSGEVILTDTFSTGITQLEVFGSEIWNCAVTSFAFSPSGQYLFGAGTAEYAQWDLWASDIPGSKVKLGGVPWQVDENQEVQVGVPEAIGVFALGPDGKLYNLSYTSHSVIEYPDEPGVASDYCIAADNPPSCLGSNVPYYLFSTPHPNYRLGPLTGSNCDTIVISTEQQHLANAGYGITASPNVASGQVEVAITLPSYNSTSTAEVQVIDMLGRVVHSHHFPPYSYLHMLDVSGWPAGLYNVLLLENGRPKAGARLVVARE